MKSSDNHGMSDTANRLNDDLLTRSQPCNDKAFSAHHSLTHLHRARLASSLPTTNLAGVMMPMASSQWLNTAPPTGLLACMLHVVETQETLPQAELQRIQVPAQPSSPGRPELASWGLQHPRRWSQLVVMRPQLLTAGWRCLQCALSVSGSPSRLRPENGRPPSTCSQARLGDLLAWSTPRAGPSTAGTCGQSADN